MRRFGKGFIVTTALVASLLASGQHASAGNSWELTEDSVNLGIGAVSPHVERTGSVDRLWYPAIPNTAVSDCTDAGACSAVAGVGRLGSDFTAVTLPSGARRAYFVSMNPSNGTKGVYTAACTTTSCLDVGTSTLTSTGLSVPQSAMAWGVPDSVVTPDGQVRLYVVEDYADAHCTEKIASYISADGISFTKEVGWRFEGGYVDPKVLRAKNGDWVMITSNGPSCGNMMQQLFVTTSTDGLSWTTPQAVTQNDKRRLDPTGYELSPNVFRIYYSYNTTSLGQDYSLKRGTLKIATATTATTATTTSTTAATAKLGGSCTKLGVKTTVNKVKLTCKKVKTKLIWSK